MKNEIKIILAVLAIGAVAGVWFMGSGSANNSDINKCKEATLPDSLDQYYQGPPVYLIEMFKLAGSMSGITVNTLQGDTENAKRSFEQFSSDYKNSSMMVPEWKNYYDQGAVKKLGKAVDEGDTQEIMKRIEIVGKTCEDCHTELKPRVWIKYNWKDFRDINIVTPEGELPWPEAKMKYLLTGFDGIGVNAIEDQQDATMQSFNLFKEMFMNMKDQCSFCHGDIERKYYVSDDVLSMIDTMETQISSGELISADLTRQQIGGECYKCHLVHEPAQRAKLQDS